jgi:hypothetical protein
VYNEVNFELQANVTKWHIRLDGGECEIDTMTTKLAKIPRARVLDEAWVAPSLVVPQQVLDDFSWWGVVHGPMKVHVTYPDNDEQDFSLGDGDILEIPPHAKHRAAAPPGDRVVKMVVARAIEEDREGHDVDKLPKPHETIAKAALDLGV